MTTKNDRRTPAGSPVEHGTINSSWSGTPQGCSCTSNRQVSWLVSHHAPSPSRFSPVTVLADLRGCARYIQWRDRTGLSPVSLLSVPFPREQTAPFAYSIIRIIAYHCLPCNLFLPACNPFRPALWHWNSVLRLNCLLARFSSLRCKKKLYAFQSDDWKSLCSPARSRVIPAPVGILS